MPRLDLRYSDFLTNIFSVVLSFGQQALELSRAEYGLNFAEREEKKRTWRWFYTGPAWDSKDPAFATGFDFSKISSRSTEALQFLRPSFQHLVRHVSERFLRFGRFWDVEVLKETLDYAAVSLR